MGGQSLTLLWKKVSMLAGGTMLANALVLISMPFLSRLYTPEDFGQLSLFISFSAIVGAVICLRYEQAVYLPSDDTDVHLLTCGAMFIAGILAVCLVLVAVLLVCLTGAQPLPQWYIIMVPLAGLGLGLYNLLSNWAVRMHLVRQVAWSRLSRAGSQVGSQLLLGVSGLGGGGLVAGDMIGRFSGFWGLLFSFRKAATNGSFNQVAIMQLLVRYKRFPWIAAPTALLNVTVMQAPAPLLAMYYSPVVAGFYFMTQRIIGAPMALIGQSIAQVYAAELGRRIERSQVDSVSLFLKVAGYLLLVGAPVLISLGALGPWIMSSFLGDSWQGAGDYILVLIPFFIAQLVVSPLANTLNLLDKQQYLLVWDVCRLLMIIPVFMGSTALGWSPLEALFLFSVLMSVMYVLLFALILRALRAHTIKPLREQA